MTSDDSASDKFTDTWKNEVGDVADVDSVESGRAGDAVVNRQEKSSPTEGTKPESKCAGSHGEDYELPSAVLYTVDKISPFDISE